MWTKRKIVLAVVLSALVGGLGYGVLWARKEADGMHNALNPQYWADRIAGRDLYNPAERYVKRGDRGSKELLLSFDDGPHPASCGKILDILKAEHCPAIFFVVGKRVKQRPDLVKRMIDEGQEVGNHTQDHLRLDQLTPKQIDNEIKNCETNVMRACGRGMSFLRPPGMRLTTTVTTETLRLGYTVIGYDVGAKDFIPEAETKISDMNAQQSEDMHTKPPTPDLIVQRVLDNTDNGMIILLHDNPVTADAITRIIETLRSRGFTFVSTSKFLADMPKPLRVVANPTHAQRLAQRTGKPVRG